MYYFLIICGLRILPDIIVMFFSMLISIVAVQSLYKKELPFYKDFQSNGEGSITTFLVYGGLTGIFSDYIN
ncbi:hypothetical protein JTS96_19035 [Clostridium botulinum]|nr:hypothetical protein [Clostridium botulinum]